MSYRAVRRIDTCDGTDFWEGVLAWGPLPFFSLSHNLGEEPRQQERRTEKTQKERKSERTNTVHSAAVPPTNTQNKLCHSRSTSRRRKKLWQLVRCWCWCEHPFVKSLERESSREICGDSSLHRDGDERGTVSREERT